jgi:hypothetical protein
MLYMYMAIVLLIILLLVFCLGGGCERCCEDETVTEIRTQTLQRQRELRSGTYGHIQVSKTVTGITLCRRCTRVRN